MSILYQLKITAASPKKDASPIGRFRRRMVEAIDLQIEIANADATGQAFTRTRQKWVKSGTKGEKELRHVPVPLPLLTPSVIRLLNNLLTCKGSFGG